MPLFRVEDWDDAYANSANIAQGEKWPDAWVKAAADFRASVGGRAMTGISCGDNPREQFDLFRPESDAKGLFVFVHGGFWLRFDQSFWSHLAAGAIARGWAVAMPTYPLCPEVRIRDIARSVSKAVEKAAAMISGPIRFAGHSAGGHLVTRLACGGTGLSGGVLGRLDRMLSISGVHDLRPMMKTAMNERLKLDLEEARAESPALLEPVVDVPVTCWVGANERSEFVRQNALLANAWRGLGLATEAVEEPDRHHFNVIDGLARPDSALAEALFSRVGKH
ncbi:MAG: alpha/beta hydrolase [Oricola sp.]